MNTFIDNDDIQIHNGLNTLIAQDGYLLANNLSERSTTHKLAEYYQHYFSEWNVDCEYNRNLGGPKKIFIDPKEILLQMADNLEKNGYLLQYLKDTKVSNIKEQLIDLERQMRKPKLRYIKELDIVLFLLKLSDGNYKKMTIYPDIIIHHRGTTDNNIVIEAKKSINQDFKARAYDLVKLMTLVSSSDFHYNRGYFIDLPVKEDCKKFQGFAESKFFSKDVYEIAAK
ncbi:MAG TPA: hypothetical protein VNW29_06960 [Candidatus Sulfotelmatobacter sp.]|jgi:hypothetical protein|nr:hypothetical protein [Candidatus Sulfotelmatobacter sp.]